MLAGGGRGRANPGCGPSGVGSEAGAADVEGPEGKRMSTVVLLFSGSSCNVSCEV